MRVRGRACCSAWPVLGAGKAAHARLPAALLECAAAPALQHPVPATAQQVQQEAAAVSSAAASTCPIRAMLDRVVVTASGVIVACWQVCERTCGCACWASECLTQHAQTCLPCCAPLRRCCLALASLLRCDKRCGRRCRTRRRRRIRRSRSQPCCTPPSRACWRRRCTLRRLRMQTLAQRQQARQRRCTRACGRDGLPCMHAAAAFATTGSYTPACTAATDIHTARTLAGMAAACTAAHSGCCSGRCVGRAVRPGGSV